MLRTVRTIRLYEIARAENIQTKHIVNVLNIVRPSKNWSASSKINWVEFDVTQRMFYRSVIKFAHFRANAENNRFVIA